MNARIGIFAKRKYRRINMACINPDGTVTKRAKTLLNAILSAATAEEIAKSTGFPLYWVRIVLRELVEPGLAEEKEGKYIITEIGRQKIDH
jgi:predicted transcriptional regulator